MKQAGFTLLETLVATALFALVMLLAIEGARLTLSGWRGIEARASAEAGVLSAQSLLRRVVASAEPVVLADGDGGLRLAFEGRAREMVLMAAVPVGAGRLSRVSIAIEDGALVAVARPVDPASRTAGTEGTREVLVDGITAGAFTYWGAGEAGEPARWHESWTGRSTLPLLVRLDLDLKGRPWPALVAGTVMEAAIEF